MRHTIAMVAAGAVLAASGAAAATPAGTPVAAPAPRPLPAIQKIGTTVPERHTLSYVSASHTLTLRYPGASYVKVHLSRLALLPGDRLTVTDTHGGQTREYRSGLTDTWALSVDGDTAVLALHGRLARLAGYGVTIDKVAYGVPPQAPRRPESVCGGDDAVDAVCYKSADPEAYLASRAVARLLINGDELCSAWRVGPNDRMLTNHHCFSTDEDAGNTEVWFDYECPVCGGHGASPPAKVLGDRVLATDANLDYTLFSVQDFGTIQTFGYLSLDVRDPAPGEELYIAEHPGGRPTQLAFDSDLDRGGNCQVHDPAADGYGRGTDVTYLCDTAGGSSGSPVLSRVSNEVVALHHFGGCPNAGVRIDLIDRQIASLL